MTKAALLNQLQIDRDSVPIRREPGPPVLGWIIFVVVLLAAAGAAAWFFYTRPDLVRVQVAEAQALSSSAPSAGASLLDASGYVVAQRQATVSGKITDKVLDVLIEEGQHVQAGQIIAHLDPSNARAAMEQANAQVVAAESTVALDQVQVDEAIPKYERNRKIHAAGFLSEQAMEDTRMARDTSLANLKVAQGQLQVARATRDIAQRSLDDTVVRAPFAGVVTVKAAQPGEIISPISAGGGFTRTGIGTIVDMDSLEVEVDVAESFINRVQQGMPATVKLNAYPDWEIPAQVIAVIPTADRSKATVTVRVGFKVKDPRIVPEMGARVSFLSPADAASSAAPAQTGVVVPPEAVQAASGGNQGVVFVIADGKSERRAVRLGARQSQGQVLLSGVRPGESVAVTNVDKLQDGAAVRVEKSKAQND
jgi:RND family efflux transporter MFP subunit